MTALHHARRKRSDRSTTMRTINVDARHSIVLRRIGCEGVLCRKASIVHENVDGPAPFLDLLLDRRPSVAFSQVNEDASNFLTVATLLAKFLLVLSSFCCCFPTTTRRPMPRERSSIAMLSPIPLVAPVTKAVDFG